MKHSCKRGDHTHHQFEDDESDSGYSSDSSFENYYLYCEEERRFLISIVDSYFKFSGDETRDRIEMAHLLRSAKKDFGCDGIPIDYICDIIMMKRKKIIENTKKIINRMRYRSHTHANNDQNTLPRKATTVRHGTPRSPKRRKRSASSNRPITDHVIVAVDDDAPDINPTANVNQNNSVQENSTAAAILVNNPENPQLENRPGLPLQIENRSGSPPRVYHFTRRELSNSDMRDNQCRLTMPLSQIVDESFFTEEELTRLKAQKSSLEVQVIDPRTETWDMNLRYRKAGNTSHCYVIGKPWNELRKINKFREKMVVDVRVFRRPEDGKLCFVLGKVAEGK